MPFKKPSQDPDYKSFFGGAWWHSKRIPLIFTVLIGPPPNKKDLYRWYNLRFLVNNTCSKSHQRCFQKSPSVSFPGGGRFGGGCRSRIGISDKRSFGSPWEALRPCVWTNSQTETPKHSPRVCPMNPLSALNERNPFINSCLGVVLVCSRGMLENSWKFTLIVGLLGGWAPKTAVSPLFISHGMAIWKGSQDPTYGTKTNHGFYPPWN